MKKKIIFALILLMSLGLGFIYINKEFLTLKENKKIDTSMNTNSSIDENKVDVKTYKLISFESFQDEYYLDLGDIAGEEVTSRYSITKATVSEKTLIENKFITFYFKKGTFSEAKIYPTIISGELIKINFSYVF